jgi:DNA-binding transcriptional ArsR family regulator
VRPDDSHSIFDVFGDDYTREILALVHSEPMTAKAIADRCNSSLPTVYRRLTVLQDLDLVTPSIRFDEEKNRRNVYESNLQSVTFELEDGHIEVDVTYKRDMSDKFEEFWRELQ